MRLSAGLLLAWCLLCTSSLFATSPIQTQIDALQTSLQSPAGIMVKNAQTGEILYASRAQQGFSPASIIKLFTTAAALTELGSDYQFNTTVYYKKAQQSGAILDGNIYIAFSGDPSFSKQNLKDLIASIKAEGISKITGNVMIDDTRFSGPFYARGWSQEDLPWYFAAPVSSVIIDENKTEIKLKSSSYIDGPATITSVSSPAIIQFTTDVRSAIPTETESLCQFNAQILPNNTFHFYGCWPKMNADKIFKVAITDPNLLVKNLITQELHENGVTLHGQIKFGVAVAHDYQVLATHASPRLPEIIKNILQDSNNIYAESLTKALGVQRYQRGTFQAGSHAIQDIMREKFNIAPNQLRLFDGTGLSNYDSSTPEAFSQVLYGMYHNAALKDYYFTGLANNDNFDAEESGTLRVRFERWLFNKPNVDVKAKTGSMTGISTLAGYIEKPNQPTLIFVIMHNQLMDKESVTQAKKFQNDVIKVLSQ